jgi:hypothetical protein
MGGMDERRNLGTRLAAMWPAVAVLLVVVAVGCVAVLPRYRHERAVQRIRDLGVHVHGGYGTLVDIDLRGVPLTSEDARVISHYWQVRTLLIKRGALPEDDVQYIRTVMNRYRTTRVEED